MYNENVEVIHTLLDAGARVDAPTGDKQTALMWAAVSNENAEILRALLEAGADVNAQDEDGKTALMHAAAIDTDSYSDNRQENPEIILALLEAGADVTARDKTWKTAWGYMQNNYILQETEAYYALQKSAPPGRFALAAMGAAGLFLLLLGARMLWRKIRRKKQS